MKGQKPKPKRQPLTVGLHSRVFEDLFQEIADAAIAENRNVSNMVRVLLTEALAHRKGNRPR